MSPRNRRLVLGGVLPLVSVLVAGGTIALATLASFGVWSSRGTSFEDPTPTEVAAALARAGISPETLAVVAASDQQVSQLASRAVAHLDASEFATLEQADESCRALEARRSELARRVQGGKGTAQDVADLRAAEADLARATAGRQGLVDDLRLAACPGLSQDQAAGLARIRVNAGWDLPVQYKVIERSPPDWVALRDALANLRVNPRHGEEVDPACQALVARCDADPEVAAAKSSLDARLAHVTAAFEQTLGLHG